MPDFFKESGRKLIPAHYFDNDDTGDFQKLYDTIAYSFDDLRVLIQEFLDILDIDNCPDFYLPIIAKYIGYELYEHDGPESQRLQLKQAAELFRLKGTEKAIQILMYGIGYYAEVIDLWSPDYILFSENPGVSAYDMDLLGASVEYGPRVYDTILYKDDVAIDPLGLAWYKTPHFILRLEQVQQTDTNIQDITEILYLIHHRIEMVRPAHTVLHLIDFIIRLVEDKIIFSDDDILGVEARMHDTMDWPYCRARYRGVGIEYIRDGAVLINRDEWWNTVNWRHFRSLPSDIAQEYRNSFTYEFQLYLNGTNFAWRTSFDTLTNGFTFQVDLKRDDIAGKQYIMSRMSSVLISSQFGVGRNGNKLFVELVDSGGILTSIETTNDVLTDDYHEVKYSYDGVTQQVVIVVDETNEATTITGTIPTSLNGSVTTNFVLGGTHDLDQGYKGYMHFPRFSSTAQLTTADITNVESFWDMEWINFDDSVGTNDLDNHAGITFVVTYGNFSRYSGEPIRGNCEFEDILVIDQDATPPDDHIGPAFGRRDGTIGRRDFAFDEILGIGETRFPNSRGGDVDYFDGMEITVDDIPGATSTTIYA